MRALLLLSLLFLALPEMARCADHRAAPLPGNPWSGMDNTPVPPGAKLTISFDRTDYPLGENVLMRFILQNTGTAPFVANFGADGDGSNRSLRFKVTAVDAQGHAAPDPDPDPLCFGGLSGDETILPGHEITYFLPFMRFCQIVHPGTYTIRATHDLGWKEGRLKIPVAETTVTFRMPDTQEAMQIIERMKKLPEPENSTGDGENVAPFADFNCLRYPVYLKPLLALAQAGDPRGVAGIGQMASPEATAALIDLAGGTDSKISLAAAEDLNDRLPDPEFSGKLPPRGPFNLYSTAARKQLASNSWDPAFVSKVRSLAHKFLASPDVANCGAFMIQAVGTLDDAPALFSALNDAAGTPAAMNPRRGPEVDSLDDPPPIPELLRASAMLYARGYNPERKPSDRGEILAYFANWEKDTPRRPAEWLGLINRYSADSSFPVREAALRSIPSPLPDSCVKLVYRGLEDEDFGVRMAACDVAGKSRRAEFIKPLVGIVSKENNEWVLRSAANSAVALGGSYDLLEAWSDRLADVNLQSDALDYLQDALKGLPGSWQDLAVPNPAARPALRDTWKKYLADHAAELRSGKKLKYNDPAVPSDLFAGMRVFSFPDGAKWPITTERSAPSQ